MWFSPGSRCQGGYLSFSLLSLGTPCLSVPLYVFLSVYHCLFLPLSVPLSLVVSVPLCQCLYLPWSSVCDFRPESHSLLHVPLCITYPGVFISSSPPVTVSHPGLRHPVPPLFSSLPSSTPFRLSRVRNRCPGQSRPAHPSSKVYPV